MNGPSYRDKTVSVRSARGELSQLGLELVVHDKDAELGGSAEGCPLLLRVRQELFLDVLLELGQRVADVMDGIRVRRDAVLIDERMLCRRLTVAFCGYRRPHPAGRLKVEYTKSEQRRTTMRLCFPSRSLPE